MTTFFARFGLRIERPRHVSQFYDRRTAPLFCAVGVIFAFVLLACVLTGFDLGYPLISIICAAAIYVAIGMVLRAYGLTRIGCLCELCTLFSLIGIGACLISLLLLSTNAPLADDRLAAIDLAWFGFDREAWQLGEFSSGWLYAAIVVSYQSFGEQPFLILPLLFLAGQDERARTFVLAWAVAIVVTVACTAVTPALGIPPYQYEFEDVFHGVRDGSIRLLQPGHLTGVVTFPSFHAAAAILFGWAAAQLRRARLFFLPWNVLMFASALLVGGHYLVDLAAGAVVAIAAILLASRIQPTVGRSVLPTD
jgi:membrane-associated phospholipid phosphatase